MAVPEHLALPHFNGNFSLVEKTEPVIGKSKSHIWLCLLEEILNGVKGGSSTTTNDGEGIVQTDDFLKQGWEGYDAGKTYVVRLSMWSVNPDESEPWRNEQVWGIQHGRWTGGVAFTKGAIRETARLVYDYES
ncbi:uncharacterized protein BCR38DRAFT_524383 [Pseudomassariella vexata]|uniref:Uncharacterized protein n=1 Tax=Pseudomassariella vexata TaxID=1141098 RepID=A0A1Y2DYH0_9PEZI|nr:uncharacterized protein BCR38DRAFT_524383 [Pseudomassariella vexata]ORY64303.1 hypothetical protein BCR38DRAFT_524383 [Pseudomassariella vexata]